MAWLKDLFFGKRDKTISLFGGSVPSTTVPASATPKAAPTARDSKTQISQLIADCFDSQAGPSRADALKRLKEHPDRTHMADALTATLLKKDWARSSEKRDAAYKCCDLLGDLGDARFYGNLKTLYEAFEGDAQQKWLSEHAAGALLKLENGVEQLRDDFPKERVCKILFQGLCVAQRDCRSLEGRLTAEETQYLLNAVVRHEFYGIADLDAYSRCEALGRIGTAALDKLLELFRGSDRQHAATVLCDMPGAASRLVSACSKSEIEAMVGIYLERTSNWMTEPLLDILGELKTPKGVAWLEKGRYHSDPNVAGRLRARAQEIIRSLTEPKAQAKQATAVHGDAVPTPRNAEAQEAVTTPLLWDAATAPSDHQLFESLRPCLSAVWDRVLRRQCDPVVVFVNLENMKWRGLLHLLCDKPDRIYLSPELLSGQSFEAESSSGVVLYRPPVVGGKNVRVGVYAAEREQVVYALCGIQGVPMPLIKQVQAVPSSGMYTVAFFGMSLLGVRHVSRDASVSENAPLEF